MITDALEGSTEGVDGDDDAAAAAVALAAPQLFLVAGKVRVFEHRNQDLVRAVPFSCQVMFPFQGQEPLTRISPSRGGREDMTTEGGERGQCGGEVDGGTGTNVSAVEGVVLGDLRTAEVVRKEKSWAGSRFMEMPSATVRRESNPSMPLPPLAMSRIADSAAVDDSDGQSSDLLLASTDATNTTVISPRPSSRRPSNVIATAFTAGGSNIAMEAISEEILLVQAPVSKPSQVPSSQLVTFPDLELDDVTGKW